MDGLVASVAAGAAPPWHVALGRRWATLWWLKFIGNTAATVGFFVLYFGVMQERLPHAWVLPLTPLDRWLELRVAALPLYASLWLYLALPPAFAKDLRELANFALNAALMSAIALTVFWFWPTVAAVLPMNLSHHKVAQRRPSATCQGGAAP
ncbi:MAG: hypothetical protein EOO26_15415, partial [Comamonadaceae bacterium]